MSPELDALACRAELAGLNAASAPREAQVEGWLLRLSPGKAKRSRCVNALAGGALPLDEVLRRCRLSFDRAGLPLILRLTPFSKPTDLDDELAARGWTRFDPADVMVLPALDNFNDPGGLTPLRPAEYAALIGTLRGSSAEEIDGHAQRLEQASVPHQAFKMAQGDALLACGQIAIDPGPGSAVAGMGSGSVRPCWPRRAARVPSARICRSGLTMPPRNGSTPVWASCRPIATTTGAMTRARGRKG